MRTSAALVILLLLGADAHAQTAPGGGLFVKITRNGAPVAKATVCVGTTVDRNAFYQSATDLQGSVRFASVPGGTFVVTAHAGAGGAQHVHAPATPANPPPLVSLTLALPLSGGPACPDTPAGAQRTFRPPAITLPQRSTVEAWRIEPQNRQHCFGAIGAECGQAQGGLPLTALCANGRCFVNPGSWDHDECCFAHPLGMACQAGPLDAVSGHDGHCVTEWDKAVRLTTRGLNWVRDVDFARTNATGTVEFPLYCAPPGALLPPADTAKCCSRQTRALTPVEQVRATAAGEPLGASR